MLVEKEDWIKTGYKILALEGLSALKVERVAKKVGISKSSFYHHFADLDNYLEQLLGYHIQQVIVLAEKEQQARSITPELVQVLLEHKLDLLFNRELRVHRSNPLFADVLLKSGVLVGNSFVNLWVRELNLRLSPAQLEAIFELALENFFLQISAERLTQAWLEEYFENLKRIAGNFG